MPAAPISAPVRRRCAWQTRAGRGLPLLALRAAVTGTASFEPSPHKKPASSPFSCWMNQQQRSRGSAPQAHRSPKRRRVGSPLLSAPSLASPPGSPGARMAAITTDAAVPVDIALTDLEQRICNLLVDVAKYVDETPLPRDFRSQVSLPDDLAKARLELRITGGWVRDKLLGVDSQDIDIGINKMTGYQFGLKLKEYLEQPDKAAKHMLAVGKDGKPVAGSLHKIEANPDKSKHLETVTTKLMGLEVDLVNLRKETYSDESRNPQIEFGTPEEDALRRDATVNAMFYNINEGIVEDFTGRGYEDMQKRIIRTPLEPYQTFKDDPLRVLRLIRFASRLDYDIDAEAQNAMRNEDIKRALKLKISRERIGKELEKTLHGPDPRKGLSLIDELGLYGDIFIDPTKQPMYTPEVTLWRPAYQTLANLLSAPADSSDSTSVLHATLVRNSEDAYNAWNITAAIPYADAPAREPERLGKRPPPPHATDAFREGIKATNKLCELVTACVQNRKDIATSVHECVEQLEKPSGKFKNSVGEDDDPRARHVLGMKVRKWGATWRLQTLFAALYEVASEPEREQAILAIYAKFLSHMTSLNILDAYALKPLIDGKALSKALSAPPGPWMKDALDVVMAWQLRNPNATDAKEAIQLITPPTFLSSEPKQPQNLQKYKSHTAAKDPAGCHPSRS
ncbi:hypothetical protein BDY21DRAFT_339476 [Lineolata rhizophorae]|uniref:Poly A polymerase head domain-containing protein n=1 Tax=Lineolata rhizophorae TaxID=578093 RepID=A0A6A6P5B4_9PEZI|nr:hypothetical protein BDY21DRAFT_339476 [Lineolata rhizophorae]